MTTLMTDRSCPRCDDAVGEPTNPDDFLRPASEVGVNFHEPADLTDADDLTAECAAARAAIRRDFDEARERVRAHRFDGAS